MKIRTRQIPLQLLISPWILSSIMAIIGLMSLLIDKRWYENLMHEQNLMYNNSAVAIFVLSSTLIFASFSWIFYKIIEKAFIYKKKSRNHDKHNTESAAIIVLVAMILNIVSLVFVQISLGIPRLIYQSSVGGASAARLEIADQIANGKFGWVPGFTIAALVWGYLNLSRNSTRFYKSLITITIVLYIFSTVVSLTRGPLFELILALAPIFILKRYIVNSLNPLWLLRTVFLFSALALLLLIGVNQLRSSGAKPTQDQTNSSLSGIVGYGPASFNRLAAVVEGRLLYPNSGSTYYALQGLWDAPLLSKLFRNFGRSIGLDLPGEGRENWLGQFVTVGKSGLRPEYIWSTAYGFILSDLGLYYGLLWFALVGAVTGSAYALFLKERIFGIFVYPFAFSSILQLWSVVYFSQRISVTFVAVAFLTVILRRLPLVSSLRMR